MDIIRKDTAKQYRFIRRLLKGTEPEPDQDSLKENPDLIYSTFVVIGSILLAIALIIGLSGKAHAQEINLDIIADIESGGNPLAVNGGHVGKYQISQGVITTYNEETKHASTYFPITLEDMYIPLYAHDMAEWFINRKIPSWLNYYGIPDTTTRRIIAWNWGIGNLRKWFKHGCHWNQLPRETRAYIKKYYQEVNQ